MNLVKHPLGPFMEWFIETLLNPRRKGSSLLFIPILSFLLFSFTATAQSKKIFKAEVIKAQMIEQTASLDNFIPDASWKNEIVRGEKIGYVPKSDWTNHQSINNSSLPLGKDPILQTKYPERNLFKSLMKSFDGISYSNVNPADPSIDVGPNHVVHMINGSSGSYVKIYNKNGNVLVNQTYLDSYTGVKGYGDPIVIYDQLADRWLLSEFASGSNKMIVAISKTPDPTQGYHIYTFATPDFPDYPKFAIWPDAYYLTTNENNQAVYALDRQKMLNGESADIQRFTIPDYPTIGFQAATPVNLSGTNLPPDNSPGLIMRMADDAWSTSIAFDRLELFEFRVDWENAENSSLTGPILLATTPFDTELCGYTDFACIQQPSSSVKLDPLREVLMNKIMYRNFGNYQAIVCTHTTDVSGYDQAGVRWYELRNENNDWGVYQEGTYAPDTDNRWMSSIGINSDGSIGLAYNISSSTTYPSIRYTGRSVCDPPGQMMLAETTIATGYASNPSNRYGDYNTMAIDPETGSFWFAAQYNPGSSWKTRIAEFEVPSQCYGFQMYSIEDVNSVCSIIQADVEVGMKWFGGFSDPVYLSAPDLPSGMNISFSQNPVISEGGLSMTLSNLNLVPQGNYTINILANSGSITDELELNLELGHNLSEQVLLQSPPENSVNEPLIPQFSWVPMAGIDQYQIDIAGDTFFEQLVTPQDLTVDVTNYIPDFTLEENTMYYWRVKPINSCGEGPFSVVRSFITEGTTCLSHYPDDLPIAIEEIGYPTIESSLFVPSEGAIRTIGVRNIDINHSWIGDLEIELESPSGTIVTLINGICSSADNMLLSFVDGGKQQNNLLCPPTDGGGYSPVSSLSAFYNQEQNGTWILRVKDKASFDGGFLNGWILEICSSGSVSSLVIPCTAGALILNSNPIIDNTYAASNYIKSGGVVAEKGNVIFQAVNSVELHANFEVKPGGVLEIRSGNCVDGAEVPEVLEMKKGN